MSGYADLSRTAYISPNDLMNSTLVNYYPQQLQAKAQNDLLTNQRNEQVINATDVEMTSRFAQTLTGMSEEEAARAYGPGIAYLQSQGFAKRAPPVFPGLEVARRLADMGVSATEQYKTRQDAAGLATVAGAYGFKPPGSGGTATPGGGGATGQARLLPGETEDQFLARIEARESGGRNVMNYRNKEDPSKFTAGGYYQIVDSTWKAGAQAAGIDISQYPTAISAPREVQTAVAKSILRNFGPQHWNQSEPGATQQANAAPRAPGSGSTPPPGVQMGGAPPGPPGGAPGPYSGGGFGTALNTPDAPQMRETFVRDPDGTVRKVLVPTGGAPVATTPPAPGGGTASNVGGDVNAMLAGINRAQTTPMGGVMAAGPAAPTAPERQASSVEPPPQPGWGTAVGSYGDGAAAPVAPPAATPPPGATQPPATRPPPAAAMPPELQTDKHNLTERDRAELGGLLQAGRISPLAFQNEVQQRQNANDVRKNHWETQQTAQQNAAATATQREVENKDRATRLQLDTNRYNADRVKESREMAPTLDEIAPLILEDKATDAQRRAYSRAMETGFLKPHMELINGAQVLVPGRIPAGYPAWDYHPPKPGGDQTAKPPQSESEKPKVISEAPPKEPPPKVVEALTEDAAGIRKIDQALDGLAKHESAVGPVYHIPLSQTLGDWRAPDSAGVRALIADIGSLKLHDRSGAAISAQEWPRLKPFIPAVTDTPSVIREKLANFQREYLSILKDSYQIYGPESGYRRLQPVEEMLSRQRSQPEEKKDKPPPAGFKVIE